MRLSPAAERRGALHPHARRRVELPRERGAGHRADQRVGEHARDRAQPRRPRDAVVVGEGDDVARRVAHAGVARVVEAAAVLADVAEARVTHEGLAVLVARVVVHHDDLVGRRVEEREAAEDVADVLRAAVGAEDDGDPRHVRRRVLRRGAEARADVGAQRAAEGDRVAVARERGGDEARPAAAGARQLDALGGRALGEDEDAPAGVVGEVEAGRRVGGLEDPGAHRQSAARRGHRRASRRRRAGPSQRAASRRGRCGPGASSSARRSSASRCRLGQRGGACSPRRPPRGRRRAGAAGRRARAGAARRPPRTRRGERRSARSSAPSRRSPRATSAR